MKHHSRMASLSLGLGLFLGLGLGLAAGQARASEAASGSFQPVRACDAYLSFKKGTNPGLVKVMPGAVYEIREVNDADRHWLRLEIPGVTEPLRWVAAECGVAKELETRAARPAASSAGAQCSTPGLQDSYVLAVTWQPGFCEHFPYNGTKPECDHLADGRLVVSNLTLHGLWPNRKQCGTRYGNCPGAQLDLSEDTVSYISPWMPNFYFEKTFGRYEWDKHGTCQTTMDDDTYFTRAVDAVRTVNDSQIGRYILANIGRSISKKSLHEKIKAATGNPQSVNSFSLICSGKFLYEIRVRLPVDFKVGSSMSDLVGQVFADRPDPDAKECRDDEIFIEQSGV